MELPAGKYWIGDPCYVIDDTLWDEFVKVSLHNHKSVPVTEFEGLEMFADGTSYGDDVYPGTNGFEYGVDSGMLSVVPVALCENAHAEDCGTFVEFKKPFEAYEENGVFHFGHIDIDTRMKVDEEETA
jgi:hypothetical protein